MMYLKCEGTVFNHIFDASAKKCSTGWLVVDEPTYTLVTGEQASQLIIALVLLWGLAKVFSLILNLMGVHK